MKRILISLLFVAAVVAQGQAASSPAIRPYIVVIMVDDMGFSHVGPYGSEIREIFEPQEQMTQHDAALTGESALASSEIGS